MKVTIQDIIDCQNWKTCSRCDEEKKEIMFSKNRRGGFRPQCKKCDADRYKNKKQKLVKLFESPSLYQRTIAWLFK